MGKHHDTEKHRLVRYQSPRCFCVKEITQNESKHKAKEAGSRLRLVDAANLVLSPCPCRAFPHLIAHVSLLAQ